MNAAFHFMGCGYKDERGIWVRGQFGHFVEALAAEVDSLDLLLDEVPNSAPQGFEDQTDFCITVPNIRLVSLGPYRGRFASIQRPLIMAQRLPKVSRRWDFILLREPSRRSPVICRWTSRIPKVFLMGADYSVTLEKFRVSMAYLRARFFNYHLRRTMRHALVFPNNEVLLENWRPYARQIVLTRTTTITSNHFMAEPPNRFERTKPCRLLYVGRLDPLKGIDDLIEALATLNQDELRFELTVVGGGNTTYLNNLKGRSHSLDLDDAIHFAGYQPAERIWDYYRSSDIFVLPTLAENISRCVWEAMSQGCPVVTTPVGGQGIVFKDREDVIFFEPGNSSELAQRIVELTNNTSLQKKLSARGIELARSNTVEIRAKEMIQTIQKWLHSEQKCF